MYVHPAFRIDHQKAFALLKARAFGTLVVVDPGGRPNAVHLPFLTFEQPNGALRVELHVAKANRIHELVGSAGCPALLTCQGPDAYISPDWYGVPDQVPTWTYTAVHLGGTLSIIPIEKAADHVDRLSAQFEQRLLPKTPWTAAKMDVQRRSAMMKAIVVMELLVAPNDIEAQWKLIQRKGIVEHRGAIAGLQQCGGAGSLAIASMMTDLLDAQSIVED